MDVCRLDQSSVAESELPPYFPRIRGLQISLGNGVNTLIEKEKGMFIFIFKLPTFFCPGIH